MAVAAVPVIDGGAAARAKKKPAKSAPALPLAVVAEDLPDHSIDGDSSRGAILEAIHEGVVVSDKSGRVRLVNRAAERILGKSRRELMGQPIAAIYGQIDSTESIEQLASAFSRQNRPLPTFAEFDDQFIQGQLIPWRNDQNEWLGIIAVFKDVTHNVKADQARNNFITALSRELRAPLTTIKGYSELILRGAMDDYSAEQLHIQQIMHSGVDRMVAVLDNAIQLGVQNKNKVVPHFQQINMVPIIDEVLEAVAPLAELHELTLSKEIKTDLPPITADRQHLYRILENLLENACQFTPPGGYVSVRAWVQHERAGTTMHPELNLIVADNGVGIPSTEFKRIFEPFYQVSGVLDSGGMGMGLTVVKELVEMHKGRVWVESVVNEGSVFQVALPLSQD
jgi:two-component system phosphate regulon sensor histidine kinase PhoR